MSLQRIDYFSPPGEFWTGKEELAWKNEHIGDIYDVFPVITFFFPLHGNDSMQFGVTMPPQVRLTVAIVTTDNIFTSLHTMSIDAIPYIVIYHI